MNEDIKKAPSPPSEGEGEKKAGIRFTAADWLAVPMAVGCALLWFCSFSLERLADNGVPALGAAAFVAAVWGSVLLYLGRGAKWNRWNGGLAAGVALLTVCCLVYGDVPVRMINLLLITCGSALAFFSLSGSAKRALYEAGAVGETVKLTALSLFSGWFKPFRALGGLDEGGRRTTRQALLGLLAALPLLLLVTALLTRADAVFASLFSGVADWLRRIDAGSLAWRGIRAAVLSMMLFSAIYFLRHTPDKRAEKKPPAPAPAPVFLTVEALLCAVYAVFAVIQFAFLFGGAETAAMEGGYAEYARSGFFQLLWVSAINLAVALFSASFAEKSRALRMVSTLLLALTAIILFSALWRMRLYILAYGLTLLRAETLWAMALIALCLALAALRVWRPGFRFWPFFAAAGLFGWIAFNCVNIDARIAEYNVDAYLDGRLEEVDIYYLSRLSPDALPALERLREAVGGDYAGGGDSDFYLDCNLDAAIDNVTGRYYAVDGWQEWCLSYARVSGGAGRD